MNATLGLLCVAVALAIAVWFLLSYLRGLKETNRRLKAELEFQRKCQEVLKGGRDEAENKIDALHCGDSLSNAIAELSKRKTSGNSAN